MKKVFFCFGWFILASCNKDCADRRNVEFAVDGSSTASYTLEVSASLQKPEDLIRPLSMGGQYLRRQYFCLTDKGVVILPTSQATSLANQKQPCFQLMRNQYFIGKVPTDTFWEPYPVINPDQFFLYYQSIPKELNLFLTVQIHGHNALLKNSGFIQKTPVSPDDLWSYELSVKDEPSLVGPKKDGSYFNLYALLHSFVLAEEDSFIYIYLPLNIGIVIPQLTGVVADKALYKEERNNFASPLFKLTNLKNTTLLRSHEEEFDKCIGYKNIGFSVALAPEKFEEALSEYKTLVEDYLHNHPGAFPDPYATPYP